MALRSRLAILRKSCVVRDSARVSLPGLFYRVLYFKTALLLVAQKHGNHVAEHCLVYRGSQFNPLECRGNYSATSNNNYEVDTLAVDG